MIKKAKPRFGPGTLFVQPIIDSNGNAIVNVQSYRVDLTSFDLNIDLDQKDWKGSGTFSQEIAVSSGKVSGSAEGLFSREMLRDIMGWSGETGQAVVVYDTPAGDGISVTSGALTIDMSDHIPSGAEFLTDLGVRDVAGDFLERDQTSPGAGKYACNEANGVYTLGAAGSYYVSCLYKIAKAGAVTVDMTDFEAGLSPKCRLIYHSKYMTGKDVVRLECVVFPKIAELAAKQGDFSTKKLEFSATLDEATKSTIGWINSER
jgi:hypothetical protein